jgi:hypothetical protein
MNLECVIKEVDSLKIDFIAPDECLYRSDGLEDLIERAANVYFFGHEGWKCEHGWPLTFSLYINNKGIKTKLGEKIVFVTNGQYTPSFEIV